MCGSQNKRLKAAYFAYSKAKNTPPEGERRAKTMCGERSSARRRPTSRLHQTFAFRLRSLLRPCAIFVFARAKKTASLASLPKCKIACPPSVRRPPLSPSGGVLLALFLPPWGACALAVFAISAEQKMFRNQIATNAEIFKNEPSAGLDFCKKMRRQPARFL